ncbi:hypothetical protein RhiirA4_478620 [Rhizophagus irregularis]|uniref:Uncharacterized protein n=1 Tax=Rhizophagus irregularis TaxID=588596 RepID=A0A2I1HF70_9GLOM|nr:hypothetical protein RhiirA4_478620 [Rhizophagus irregularis]
MFFKAFWLQFLALNRFGSWALDRFRLRFLGVSALVFGRWIGFCSGFWALDGNLCVSIYIHWAADVREDSAGLISFQKSGAHEFIDASAIDYCVGFFQIKLLIT